VKLTWWKGVNFLPGGGRGGKISGNVNDALEHFAAVLTETPLPENQLLVITATKLNGKSIFAKSMAAIAEMHECFVPERSNMRAAAALARLPALAKAENLTFEPGADRAFIAKTGPDTRNIVSELAKMRTYLGEDHSTVTEDDVAAITSTGGDDIEIWALTDALASRNPGKVLTTLRNFQGDSGWPIMISTVVERWFRDLIVVKAGGGGNDWKARKNAAAAAGFTLTELRIARYRMLALREKLVSSQPTGEYVEMEILRTIKRGA
jgi:DNA polymerase III delta subunit